MRILAQSPIMADHITPYYGKAIAAVLPSGDVVCGIVDRVHEGHLFMRPIENVPEAYVLSLKKSLGAKYKNKAQVKALAGAGAAAGAGFGGFPLGWGFGNFGWGAGLWWVFPLFLLAALAALPFFWW
ncbi:hypothetical protein ACFFK0_00590 [Paenibacillus chartarius]|uniref:S1 motif domain-containing protein n=1 Tax=Paenibacillus chartarius TaxID=747481 RepID=A0ABV6DE78_9BACL